MERVLEHFRAGQVVQAPLWADTGLIDPMFFATFVKSTPAHATRPGSGETLQRKLDYLARQVADRRREAGRPVVLEA